MRKREAWQIRDHIDPTQLIGFPTYFFDFSLLIANVPTIATWSAEKLQSVIGTRVDGMLGRADMRIPTKLGFFVVFSTRQEEIAQERANAICTDVLKHFFGTDSLIPEGARNFCRQASVLDLVSELGSLVSSPDAPAAADETAGRTAKAAEAEGQSASLMEQMNALFRRHFGEEKQEGRKFLYAPLWDSSSERIASFYCQPASAATANRLAASGEKSSTSAAEVHCASDIAALAFALKGLWQIVARGEVALISAPVHIETLSWSKHRAAYLSEIAHIEPRMLQFLAFRICGLDAGSSLSQLSQGVSVLRRHGRRIFVHLPTVSLDFSHAGMIGVSGFGISAPSHPPRQGEGPLHALAAVATRLKRICASQNAIAYVDQVHSAAAVALLKAQGIRLVAGSIFGEPSEEPAAVRALSLAELSAGPREAPGSQRIAI